MNVPFVWAFCSLCFHVFRNLLPSRQQIFTKGVPLNIQGIPGTGQPFQRTGGRKLPERFVYFRFCGKALRRKRLARYVGSFLRYPEYRNDTATKPQKYPKSRRKRNLRRLLFP